MDPIRSLDEYKTDKELEEVLLFKDYPPILLNFATVCCVIFITIGVPGNLLTILSLSFYKKVHNATAFFIINLSISDFLFCCTILPFTTGIFVNAHWVGGKTMCKLHAVFNYGFTACGVFTIVAITINRYVMVAHPNIYPRMYTSRNILLMIIAIWLGAFGMLLPIVFEVYGRFSLDPAVGFCTIVSDKNNRSPKNLIIIMGFIIPCFVIIACYTRIFWIVRRSTKTCKNDTEQICRTSEEVPKELSSIEVSSQEETEPSSGVTQKFRKVFRATIKIKPKRGTRPTKRDKKLQAMIFTIIATFFACHLPILIAKLVSSSFATHPCGNIMGYIMLYLTTCSNPIIYVVLSSEYKKAYKYFLSNALRIFR